MKIRPENIVRFLLLIKQAMIKVMGFEYTFFLVRFCLQLAFILPSAHLHHSIHIPIHRMHSLRTNQCQCLAIS